MDVITLRRVLRALQAGLGLAAAAVFAVGAGCACTEAADASEPASDEPAGEAVFVSSGPSGDDAPDCGGLGCPICTDSKVWAPLCTTTTACTAGTDCKGLASGPCRVFLGTGTLDFYEAGCIGGHCVHHVVRGGCMDGTPCKVCSTRAKAVECGFQPSAAACAACCSKRYAGETYANLYRACACAPGRPCAVACATSAFCGGSGPETTGCVACLKETLTDGGACVASEAFQAACVHETGGSHFCSRSALCLVGCPAS